MSTVVYHKNSVLISFCLLLMWFGKLNTFDARLENSIFDFLLFVFGDNLSLRNNKKSSIDFSREFRF